MKLETDVYIGQSRITYLSFRELVVASGSLFSRKSISESIYANIEMNCYCTFLQIGLFLKSSLIIMQNSLEICHSMVDFINYSDNILHFIGLHAFTQSYRN